MKNINIKRFMAAGLALIMMASSALANPYMVRAEDVVEICETAEEENILGSVYGKIGDNITWSLVKDEKASTKEVTHYVLTLEGTGDMYDPTYSEEFAESGGSANDGDWTPWGRISDYSNVISTVIVSEGITSIAQGAFEKCRPTKIYLPSTLETIGAFAFSNILAEKIVIPKNVKKIGDYAFEGGCIFVPNDSDMPVVKGLEFEEGSKLEYIGAYCFVNCIFSEVTIPKSVKYIGWEAFPETVKKVNFEAGSVIEQLNGAFVGCHLDSVIIPASVKSLSWLDIKAKKIEFEEGSSCSYIEESAFYFSESGFYLKSLSLPDGLRVYSGDSWNNLDMGLERLEELVIPDTTMYISKRIFGGRGIPASCKVVYNKELKWYKADENGYPTSEEVDLEKERPTTNICRQGYVPDEKPVPATNSCGEDLTWRIEDRTLYISGNGLYMNDYSSKYYSEEGVPYYGYMGQIDTVDFSGAPNLKRIGERCFYFTALDNNPKTIVVPASVEEIGHMAFGPACTVSFEDTDEKPSKLKVIEREALFNARNTELTFPRAVEVIHRLNVSQKVTKLTVNSGKIMGESSPTINNLEELYIGPGVTEIGASAFMYSTKLKKLEFTEPEKSKLKAIGTNAFEYCYELKNVEFPENCELEMVPALCFSQCQSLEKVVLPKNIKIIGYAAFDRCEKLSDVALPDRLKEIHGSAFHRCALKEVTLPESLCHMGAHAFTDNEGLVYKGVVTGWKTIDNKAYKNLNEEYYISDEIYRVNGDGITKIDDSTAKDTETSAYDKEYYVQIMDTDGSQLRANGATVSGLMGMDPNQPLNMSIEEVYGTLNKTTEGYKLTGWSYKKGSSSVAIKVNEKNIHQKLKISDSTADNPIRMYAKWTPVSYKILYNLNGGKIQKTEYKPNKYSVTGADLTKQLGTPVKPGYKFEGWYVDIEDEESKVTCIGDVLNNEKSVHKYAYKNIKLNAKWSEIAYKIELYPNTANYSKISVAEQIPAELADRATVVGEGNNKHVEVSFSYSEPVDMYELSTCFKYDSAEVTASEQKGIAGFAIADVANAKAKYVVSKEYSKLAKKSASDGGVVKLYAVEGMKPFGIKYDLNGGTNSKNNPHAYTYNENKAVKLKKPSKVGYVFDKWIAISGNDAGIFDENSGQIAKGATGNLTLEAQWKPAGYVVVLDKNNKKISYANGAKITYGDANSKNYVLYDSKEGFTSAYLFDTNVADYYTFKGWNTKKNGKGTWAVSTVSGDSVSGNRVTDLTEEVALGGFACKNGKKLKLYAIWEANTLNINYVNLDSGEIFDATNSTKNALKRVVNQNTKKYTAGKKIKFKNPLKYGYKFDGWSANYDSGEKITSIPAWIDRNGRCTINGKTVQFDIYDTNLDGVGDTINIYGKWTKK